MLRGNIKIDLPFSIVHPSSRKISLLLQAQFLNKCVVALLVGPLEILQMRAAVCDHLEETTARVLVFEVFLQMRGKLVDFLRQKGDLDLGRARIRIMYRDFLNSLGLFLLRKHI